MNVAKVYKADGGYDLISLDEASRYLHKVMPNIMSRAQVDAEFEEHKGRIWKEVWSEKMIRGLLARGVPIQTDTMWFVAVKEEE